MLKRNGQWLNREQQDQLVAYRKFNQSLAFSDSQKLAFFEGFMSEIDPETMREFKEAMQEALPFFQGVGRAAGDVVDGLMKLTNWITGKLNLLTGDNSTKEAVSQHYGTTSAPAQPEVIQWLTPMEPASRKQTAHTSLMCSIHSMIGGTGQATLRT